MKKLLLSLLTVICAIGLANAESKTETVTIKGQTATYNDNTTYVFDATTMSPTSSKYFTSVTLGELFTLELDKATGSNYPTYNKNGEFRVYANNIVTFKAIDGIKMTKIVFTSPSGSPTFSAGKYDSTSKTWESTDGVSELELKNTSGGQFNFTKLEITYEQVGEVVIKEEAELSFPEEEYEANIGEEFTAPLTKATTADVTYASSDETVATVDPTTGVVTPLAVGVTTITASTEENEQFKAGKAQYKLSVVDPNATEATFDFVNKDYDMPTRGGSVYNSASIEFSEGIVSAKLTTEETNATRLWTDGLRVYKKVSILTLSVPAGYAIDKVVFTKHSSVSVKYNDTELTDNTWTGEAAEVAFTLNSTSNQPISEVYVSYKKVEAPQNPELPVIKVGGQELTDEYTLNGEDVELTFEVAEGVSIWYKFVESGAAAPAAETDATEADNDGYTKLEGTTLTIGNIGQLSYYAEANGLKSEVNTITFNGTPSGIAAVEAADNAAAEYFTIQGVKANAETLVPGLYIRRAGNKATKVIVK